MAESRWRPSSALRGAARFFTESSNRGWVLDLVVFVLNLTAMGWLAQFFLTTIRRAGQGDQTADRLLFGMAALLFVLAPLGATLKRWHFHDRGNGKSTDLGSDPMGGCLFNPIFYFCLTAVIFSAVNAYLLQTYYGRREPDGGVFATSILVGLALMIGHTILVYRYFVPPKSAPKLAFLRSPGAGFIGEVCLFANMVLFQLIWNLLSMAGMPPPTGLLDGLFRLLVLAFLALLLYFPPRMFYLAQDIGRRGTWFMILLANVPILVRVLFGYGSGLNW